MKLIKSLLAVSLATFSVFPVHADVIKISPSVQEKNVQKNATQTKAEQNLKLFTDTISVKFLGFDISKDKTGQLILNLKYSVQNKSKRNIRTVHWSASYIHRNTIIFIQDTPISFKDNLKRGTTSELVFSTPLNSLPKETQALLSQPRTSISANYQPKSIVFSNGAKIIVE